MFDTPKEAATALGVPYNTYIQHENGNRGFANMAARYAKFFHVSVDHLLAEKGSPSPKLAPSVARRPGDGISIKGFVRAGVWQETYHVDGDGTDQTLPISKDVRYAGREQFALEIQGESMNRRFRPGEYAICVTWDGDAKQDDIVVVERERNGLFEATLKMLKNITPKRMELWPDSTLPEYQSPIILNGDQVEDGETVRIVGRVIGAYRKA